jgi:hypothetical protein
MFPLLSPPCLLPCPARPAAPSSALCRALSPSPLASRRVCGRCLRLLLRAPEWRRCARASGTAAQLWKPTEERTLTVDRHFPKSKTHIHAQTPPHIHHQTYRTYMFAHTPNAERGTIETSAHPDAISAQTLRQVFCSLRVRAPLRAVTCDPGGEQPRLAPTRTGAPHEPNRNRAKEQKGVKSLIFVVVVVCSFVLEVLCLPGATAPAARHRARRGPASVVVVVGSS